MSVTTRRKAFFFTPSFDLISRLLKNVGIIDVNRLMYYYLTMFIHLAWQPGG